MELDSQPAKLPYTIIFLTPRCAVPSFLFDLQQRSTLSPIFIGKHARFFRRENATNWPWSHILVFEGHEVELPEDWMIRQQWRFTFESQRPFSREPLATAQTHSHIRAAEDGSSIIAEHEGSAKRDKNVGTDSDLPEWLRNELKPVVTSLTSEQPIVGLSFLEVPRSGTSDDFTTAPVTSTSSTSNIYASGPVIDPGEIVSNHHSSSLHPEAFNYFTFRSFPSAKELGAYLMDVEAKKNGEDAPRVRESMVLTQEFTMPTHEIDPRGWKYGNPHEPYGEDWFG